MADINSITNAAAYTGNKNLGGYADDVIDIDTKPLEDLAKYTVIYNQAEYNQRQKDTDAKVAQLATIADISLNSLRGKDKDYLTGQYVKFLNDSKDYASYVPKNQQDKIRADLDWQTKKNAFLNDYNSGKGRALAYQSRLNNIKKTTEDAKTQDEQISQLDKEFNDTDITTCISATSAYKLQSVGIPQAIATKFDLVGIGANENTVTTATVYNPATNLSAADGVVFGLTDLYPKKGTPEYDKLSDNEKQQADQQATVVSPGKTWADMAQTFNAVKNQKDAAGNLLYYDADGNFNDQKFVNDNTQNAVVTRAYNALKSLNDYSKQRFGEATNGIFSDHGLQYKLPAGVNPTDFKSGFVDFSKNIDPSQMVQAGMFAQYAGDQFSKKLETTETATKLKIAADTNALGWGKLGLDEDEFALKQKQFEATQKGSATQINGATERAQRIYGDLQKLTDKNGFITPDKVRQLNVEQRKYLGIDTPRTEKDGIVTDAGGFKPLDLSDKEYGIQLDKGNIKVLGDAKPITDGRYVGTFDNTKSTNVFNVATNILNEELKTAGSKELNSYWGVDVTNSPTAITDNTSSTTKSSSAATKSRVGKDGKTYTSTDGITWTASDGTTVTLKQ